MIEKRRGDSNELEKQYNVPPLDDLEIERLILNGFTSLTNQYGHQKPVEVSGIA